jgi:hypothetical protein
MIPAIITHDGRVVDTETPTAAAIEVELSLDQLAELAARKQSTKSSTPEK